MSHVAFVAHGLGQQPVIGAFFNRLIVRRKPLAAEIFHERHGLEHSGPHLGQKDLIPAKPVVVHYSEDEFAPAVIFRQPLTAIPIRAVRQISVFRLKFGIPADKIPHLLFTAHPQKGRPHHGAVANPRTRVATRPGVQGRAIAVDQDMGGACFEGADYVLGRLRQPNDCSI